MKAATLRTFRAVHTGVGLVAGMALFIAFYAGAIIIFEHELIDWQQPAGTAASAAAPGDEIPAGDALGRSQALLDAFLAGNAGATNVFLVLPGDHGPEPSLYSFEGNEQRRFELDAAGSLKEGDARAGFVEFIYDLHFTAGLPRAIGTYFLGVICILYGLALVSGVILYAPVFLKDLFALRPGKNLKRFWQDAHNVIGMLSLPFHTIFAWSGAVLCIGFVLLAPFQFLVYEGKLLEIVEPELEIGKHQDPTGVAAPMLPLADLVERAQRELPALAINSVSFEAPGDAQAQAVIFGEIAQRRLTGNGGVALRAATGDVIEVSQPSTQSPGQAFLYGLISLHYGNFGHYAVKWLYFLLGLAGAFLFYSGNLLFIEARRRRHQTEQRRSTRLLAALTLGVCLGCIAGVSALFLAGALAPEAWVRPSYFGLFFGSIAWALLRPPARAAHELLLASALLTALIPLAGWLASGEHLVAALWHGHWSRFLIDATALAFAYAYLRLARATLRRGYEGKSDSVWTLRTESAASAS